MRTACVSLLAELEVRFVVFVVAGFIVLYLPALLLVDVLYIEPAFAVDLVPAESLLTRCLTTAD